jgi:hypothetical protein
MPAPSRYGQLMASPNILVLGRPDYCVQNIDWARLAATEKAKPTSR